MADLRLMVVLVLAACGQAGAAADQASGIAPPAGWQVAPSLAAAARTAIGPGVTIDGVEAWAEPAMGCYGVWLAIRSSGGAETVAEQVLAGFAAQSGQGSAARAKVEVQDVVKPSGTTGVLALTFTRAPYRGRLRAQLGGDKITALACFANAREPIACETACNVLLGAFP